MKYVFLCAMLSLSTLIYGERMDFGRPILNEDSLKCFITLSPSKVGGEVSRMIKNNLMFRFEMGTSIPWFSYVMRRSGFWGALEERYGFGPYVRTSMDIRLGELKEKGCYIVGFSLNGRQFVGKHHQHYLYQSYTTNKFSGYMYGAELHFGKEYDAKKKVFGIGFRQVFSKSIYGDLSDFMPWFTLKWSIRTD